MTESHQKTIETEERFLSAHRQYADALYRYIFFKISDHERAGELVQEAFMKTWNYMQQGGIVENMQAFLYKTAGNLSIDEYRKRKPVDSLETMHENIGFDPAFDDTGCIQDRIDGESALSLLSKLPEQYREALLMRYVEELSLSEMSEITGESENTLAVRIHRGIEKLRKIFNHEE